MNVIKNISGKKVVIKGNLHNIPSMNIIKNVYSKIPDDKKIPIVFETKTQYLNEYIKNQEKAKGKPFPKTEVSRYKRTELSNMSNIVSRYTTKKNPFIDVRTVFFTDKKITPEQFAKSAFHEYGHEAWESKPKLRQDWKSLNKGGAPTSYGQTSRQEDVAESYMLYKTGGLQDPRRGAIIGDNISQSRKSYRKVLPSVKKIMMAGGGAPEHYSTYMEGLHESKLDLSQFDINHDGKIDDKDIDLMRKKGLLKGIEKDKTSGNSVGDALGWAIPEEVASSSSWKLYGAPKAYDPRVQERGDLKGNIFKITREHYQTVGRSPLLWKDTVSQNFGILQGLKEDSPIKGTGNILKAAVKSAYTGEEQYEGDTRKNVVLTPKPVAKALDWTASKYASAKEALKYKPIDPTKPIPGPKWLARITHPMTTAQQEGLLTPAPTTPSLGAVTPEELLKLGVYSGRNKLYALSQQKAIQAVPRIEGGIYKKKAFILQ